MENQQGILKGSFSSVATILISTGVVVLSTSNVWAGVALCLIGVSCIFGREYFKRYDKKYKKNTKKEVDSIVSPNHA